MQSAGKRTNTYIPLSKARDSYENTKMPQNKTRAAGLPRKPRAGDLHDVRPPPREGALQMSASAAEAAPAVEVFQLHRGPWQAAGTQTAPKQNQDLRIGALIGPEVCLAHLIDARQVLAEERKRADVLLALEESEQSQELDQVGAHVVDRHEALGAEKEVRQ